MPGTLKSVVEKVSSYQVFNYSCTVLKPVQIGADRGHWAKFALGLLGRSLYLPGVLPWAKEAAAVPWHRLSKDQLFTHSRMSAAGSTGPIKDDERVLRDAWHTEPDVRKGVLKRVFLSLTKTEAGAGGPTAAEHTEGWLKMCADKAGDEVGARARRRKDAR